MWDLSVLLQTGWKQQGCFGPESFSTWTPKVCKTMAFWATLSGFGPLFYMFWGSGYGVKVWDVSNASWGMCWSEVLKPPTILYYTMLYDTILYYTILYYTILYYTILYYTILYYTILYYAASGATFVSPSTRTTANAHTVGTSTCEGLVFVLTCWNTVWFFACFGWVAVQEFYFMVTEIKFLNSNPVGCWLRRACRVYGSRRPQLLCQCDRDAGPWLRVHDGKCSELRTGRRSWGSVSYHQHSRE